MKVIKPGMARDHYKSAMLARARAIDKKTAARRFGDESSSIFYCPSCGAPVVNSGPGRLGHATRQPRCREAMGL